jgi:hypothetical protein
VRPTTSRRKEGTGLETGRKKRKKIKEKKGAWKEHGRNEHTVNHEVKITIDCVKGKCCPICGESQVRSGGIKITMENFGFPEPA